MDNKDEKIFKTANDLKVNVTKLNGEVVIDEECCTMVSILLKNTGDIAASFFGAHNPNVIKILEKSLKKYFKSIKKELKNSYQNGEEEIKVVTDDIPVSDKWSGESVPDLDAKDKTAKTTKPTKIPATKISPATKKSNTSIKNTQKSTKSNNNANLTNKKTGSVAQSEKSENRNKSSKIK